MWVYVCLCSVDKLDKQTGTKADRWIRGRHFSIPLCICFLDYNSFFIFTAVYLFVRWLFLKKDSLQSLTLLNDWHVLPVVQHQRGSQEKDTCRLSHPHLYHISYSEHVCCCISVCLVCACVCVCVCLSYEGSRFICRLTGAWPNYLCVNQCVPQLYIREDMCVDVCLFMFCN